MDYQFNTPTIFEVWFIDVGIVDVKTIRVIAAMDNDPRILDKMITSFIKKSGIKDISRGSLIVETNNHNFDYTLSIFRDNVKQQYEIEIEKRMISGKRSVENE